MNSHILTSLLFVFFFLPVPIFIERAVFHSKFNIYINWILGILFIGFLAVIMNGLSLQKKDFFIVIILLSFLGMLFIVKNFKINFLKDKNILIENIFIILLFLPTFLAVVIHIIQFPLEQGDAFAYWYAKAKSFYYWVLPSQFLNLDGGTTHYPNLGSAIWFLGMQLSHGNEIIGRVLFVLIVFSCTIGFYEMITRNNRHRYGIYTRFLLILLVIYYLNYMMNAKLSPTQFNIYNGLMDWFVGIIPALSYCILGSIIFFSEQSKISINKVMSLAFLFGAAALIKAEGSVHILTYLVSVSMWLIFYYSDFIRLNKLNILLFFILILFISSVTYLNLFFNDIEIKRFHEFSIDGVLNSYKHFGERIHTILYLFLISIKKSIMVILPFILLILLNLIKKDLSKILFFVIPIILYHLYLMLVFMSVDDKLFYQGSFNSSFVRLYHQIDYFYIFSSMILTLLFLNEKKNKDINQVQNEIVR